MSQIYRAFGLGSSYAKVLKFGFLLQAAKYQIAGRGFPDFPYHLLGNIYQVRRRNLPHLRLFLWLCVCVFCIKPAL